MSKEAIHPGEHVQEEMDALGLTAKEFAEQLGVPSTHLGEFLAGRRPMDAEMALRLGHYFGISPEFWLKLQNLYDLRLAEEQIGEKLHALPVAKHLQAA